MTEFKLIKRILDLSESDNWISAKKEWVVANIFEEEAECLCGHSIFENCQIENKNNGNSAIVGNVCVNKFLELDSDKLFQGIKKIRKDLNKSTSRNLLDFCLSKKVLTQIEYDFYVFIIKKRKLHESVFSQKRDINSKIVLFFLKEEDVERDTLSLRYDILKEQKWRCAFCWRKIYYGKKSMISLSDNFFREDVAQIDHKHPYSKRFSYKNGHLKINERNNLQALCLLCNTAKGDLTNSQYLTKEIQMENLRTQALAFEPTQKTHNIADLKTIDIDSVVLLDENVPPNENTEGFSYKYIVVDNERYRVPAPVIGQLKTHLDASPTLKYFRVVRQGTGKQTTYTVVPLS